MKKTISVQPESYVHKCIDRLMSEIGFKEIERVSRGGYMSPIEIILTYEGEEREYHEKSFIANQDGVSNLFDCVSLKMPYSTLVKSLNDYRFQNKPRFDLAIQRF